METALAVRLLSPSCVSPQSPTTLRLARLHIQLTLRDSTHQTHPQAPVTLTAARGWELGPHIVHALCWENPAIHQRLKLLSVTSLPENCTNAGR